MFSFYKCRITNMEPIKRAIKYFGSAKKLADALGVTTQAVCFWRDGKRGIDADIIASIERVTNGHVTRQEFRPDTYQLTWPELQESPNA
ncbi:MAG: hypothetical protein B7X10_02020 [Burkholderiales bacterium 21-58-4]|nr:MAG: hypothetical protein B7X10_02020 [Burkholderiales bacterium 21-58-4]